MDFHVRRSRLDTRRRKLAGRVTATGAAALLLVTGSCYPNPITDVEETDLVLTFYDTRVDFGAVRTYVMPDTIVRTADEGEVVVGSGTVVGDFDDMVLDEVEIQLAALGYQRIREPGEGSPDVAVLVTVNVVDTSYWVPGCWYCYWGWYPWGPNWGWEWGPAYVPGYPWASGELIRRSVGTLLVTMLAPVTVGTELPALWVGAANGLLSRDTDTDVVRVQRAVGQMFAQSPYLGGGL